MKSLGNSKAREMWEAKVPNDYKRPTPNDSQSTVKKWIVAKYEDKEFMGEPSQKKPEIASPQPPSIQVENLFHFDSTSDQKESPPIAKKPSDDFEGLFTPETLAPQSAPLQPDRSPTISNKVSPNVQHSPKSPITSVTSPSQARTTMQPNYNPPGMGSNQQPYGFQQQFPQQQFPQQQYPQQQLYSGFNQQRGPQLQSPVMSPMSSPSLANKSSQAPMGGMGQKPAQAPTKSTDPFADLYQQMK